MLSSRFPTDVWFAIYYPSYDEPTSSYHPLRGSILIHFWHDRCSPAHGRLDDGVVTPTGLIELHRQLSRIPRLLEPLFTGSAVSSEPYLNHCPGPLFLPNTSDTVMVRSPFVRGCSSLCLPRLPFMHRVLVGRMSFLSQQRCGWRLGQTASTKATLRERHVRPRLSGGVTPRPSGWLPCLSLLSTVFRSISVA